MAIRPIPETHRQLIGDSRESACVTHRESREIGPRVEKAIRSLTQARQREMIETGSRLCRV